MRAAATLPIGCRPRETPSARPRLLPLALLVNESRKRSAVREAGFEVLVARDPEEARELLAHRVPDVVVVGMGSTAGTADRALRFVRELRATPRGACLPLVMLAKRPSAETVDLAYAAGATDVWIDGAAEAVWRKRLPFVMNAARALREIQNTELRLHSLSNYDTLTGLLNRHSFLDLLAHTEARRERSGGSLAVALLDVDRFKEINESLGHRAGDRLLREMAGRLLSSIRKGDCIAREGGSSPGTLARRGGDEFLVLLSDVREAHHAGFAARRLLESLRPPFRIDGMDIFASASVGIAFAKEGGSETEELLRQAEIAMYSAKAQGRNGIQFFDESMNAAVVERFELETLLRGALARGELQLFYQPLVRARTREIVGVEALLRWWHPVRGLLSADEFVSVAEEAGLLVEIGRWVLRTACQQLRQWEDQGLRSLRLSVNLSPRELRAPGFVAGLAKILEETEVQPGQLELELTERGVVGNDPRTLDVLLRLKEMGVRLAVDDFGTGNTTFQYLKNFPLTTLKIDKSFLEGIAGGEGKNAAITKALLAMARRLELNVVAEGVENEDQLSFLGENDCDEVQGYLFGRPSPAEGLLESIA